MSWYRGGTATITQASNVVTGVGTLWVSQAVIGNAMVFPDGQLYEIQNITSDSQITLATPYAGVSAANVPYMIVPTQSYLQLLASQVTNLIALYQTIPTAWSQGTAQIAAYVSQALGYRNDAATSDTAATAAATAAAGSATTATGAATSATTSATAASTSATNAAGSSVTASASATAAAGSATAAAGSASTATGASTAATASASTASTAATNAGNSATAAAASASAASASQSTASAAATNAGNSATAAANSATSASGSASTATTQAGNASTSATNASNSASAASTSAGNASTSATNASNSATAAANSASTAASTVSSKAAKGANSDITSLTGLTTALGVAYGGTGATTIAGIQTALGIQASALIPGKRNLLHNSNFWINQRGTGAVNSGFLCDRWQAQQTKGTGVSYAVANTDGSAGQTPTGGYSYAQLQATGAAGMGANDYIALTQNIEGVNIAAAHWGFAWAKPITLSFDILMNYTGLMSVTIRNGSQNNWSYMTGINITTANVWQRVTVTIPGPTTGGATAWPQDNTSVLNLFLCFGAGSAANANNGGASNVWFSGTPNYAVAGTANLMATSGNYVRIAAPQLEIGSTATPYEVISYAEDFQKCQRYFVRTGVSFVGAIYGSNGDTRASAFYWPVVMRTSPTVTFDIGAQLSGFALGDTSNAVNVGFTFAWSVNNLWLSPSICGGITVAVSSMTDASQVITFGIAASLGNFSAEI